MNLDFQQGLISYPSTGLSQTFLVISSQYVTLSTANGVVQMTLAFGDANYLLSETQSTPNAWGPIAPNTDTWLYIDINLATGVRTFGTTLQQPTVGGGMPTSTNEGHHWFDTTARKMYVKTAGIYRACLRVFVAKVNNATFTPLGSGIANKPFAGTQVGLNTPNQPNGFIVYDEHGKPIRKSDGSFFTTTSDIVVMGANVNLVRLDSSVLIGAATEPLAKYHVVKYSNFGQLAPAEYDDASTTAIAMLLEDLTTHEVGSVCIQGVVTNPLWSWSVVGQPLWIGANGSLVSVDPHLTHPLTHTTPRPPVGRVLTETSIFFDQGLGGRGEKGEPGDSGAAVASTTSSGLVRLSTPAAIPSVPVVVGDNDPRVANAVLKTGDVMTGLLTLSGNPTAALHAATKQYVDGVTTNPNAVLKTGDVMTGLLTLSGNPTAALHAATKQYVDTKQTPYDLTLACSDASTPLVATPSIAFVTAPRTFGTISFRADVLTPSTSGAVSITILINESPATTISIPANATTSTVAYATTVTAGQRIRVSLTDVGTGSAGLIVTIVGVV